MIIVVATIDAKTNKIIVGPDVISRGFVYVREADDLIESIKEVARNSLVECFKQSTYDWSTLKQSLKQNLGQFVYQKTKRNPMILPVIIEV